MNHRMLPVLAATLLVACAGDPARVTVGEVVATSTTAPTTTPEPELTAPPVTPSHLEPSDEDDDDQHDDEDDHENDDEDAVTTTTSPTDECRAGVDGLPVLVLASDGTVARFEAGTTRSVPLAGVQLAYSAGDDVVIAQVATGDDRSDLVRLDAQGAAVLETGPQGAVLFDVAKIDGWPTVFYGSRPGDDLDADPGQLLSRALGATTPTTLGVAFAPEYAVLRTSTGGGLVAVSAITDQTEQFSFLHLDGSAASGVANPTTDAPYAAPPLWVEAVLSPDGTEYAYLEGPDSYGGQDPDQLEGDWQLVVLGADGAERFRTTLAPQERDVWRIDFDGRFVVASIAEVGADEPDEVVVVDTSSTAGPVTLCDLSGTATFAD